MQIFTVLRDEILILSDKFITAFNHKSSLLNTKSISYPSFQIS